MKEIITTNRHTWTYALKSYDDFPKPGIHFYDIFAVLLQKHAFQDLISCLQNSIPNDIDFIIGIDSRGFIFAPLVAYLRKTRFVPIRKTLKLPGATFSQKYTLEYGENCLEIQQNIFAKFSKNHKIARIVIIDDLIATGGSLEAAIKILANFRSIITIKIIKVISVLEIKKLRGRNLIEQLGIKFESLHVL